MMFMLDGRGGAGGAGGERGAGEENVKTRYIASKTGGWEGWGSREGWGDLNNIRDVACHVCE